MIRCSASFCHEVEAFAASGQEEAWLKIDLSKSKRKWKSSAKRIVNKPAYLQVRCIKVVLHGGGSMYLLTNLNSTELPVNQANELYDFRWREETSYDVDKNVLEVENFSSKTPNGVYQDYHAKILTVNITQLLINDAQVVLDQNQASKNNKHDYQINKRVAIGLVKDELPKLLLDLEDSQSWYDRLFAKIIRRTEIKKSKKKTNKKGTRKKKHKLKYHITRRRVI